MSTLMVYQHAVRLGSTARYGMTSRCGKYASHDLKRIRSSDDNLAKSEALTSNDW